MRASMKRLNEQELKDILDKHGKWLKNEEGGNVPTLAPPTFAPPTFAPPTLASPTRTWNTN